MQSVCLLSLLLLLGCSAPLLPPTRLVHRDDRPIPAKPRGRHPSLANAIIDKTTAYQLKQVLDTPRLVRKLVGRPYEALNVDNFDQVPNSTWFVNRNGRRPLSLEEIRRGPNRSAGPDTTGKWRVVALKSAGVTPGMTIVDGRGTRYIIKFDPPDFAELPSGTEAVLSKLFYAVGYNVPENYIVHLDPNWLEPDPDAVMTVETNDKRKPISQRPLSATDLETVLAKANPQGAGRVRVLASRFLPGIPIGPWSYTGVRRDDPNDVYSHQHRREVRGLYIIASWLNHADMKEENTLDMYDPERRLVTHYLIDFGSAAGSNAIQPSSPRRGQANSFDLKDSFTRLVTAGLYVHGYERAEPLVRYPSVGYLENDLFKPHKWKPMYPVPAFENLTLRDAFWGAQIVTSFTDAQIETAVATGEYSVAAAAEYFARFLRQRRDMIGRYWFARVNTLDQFEIAGGQLRGVDVAVERGYAAGPATRYRIEVRSLTTAVLAADEREHPHLDLDVAWKEQEYIAVSFLPRRPGYKVKPVVVYLRTADDEWEIVGLHRLD